MTHIRNLVDNNGHCGPYPGGGGCFDYDYVNLVSKSNKFTQEDYNNFYKLLKSLISEQNNDGGFAESYKFIPLSFKGQIKFINHFLNSKSFREFKSILRTYIYIMRTSPIYISNHFCSNSKRKWSESDLWNSWFRTLTIITANNKIFKNKNAYYTRKINFPGIGYTE